MKLALRLALVAAASIALAGVLTIVLFDVLMHASRSHTIEGLQYLVTTGIVSLVAGTAGLLAVSRYVPSLGLKIGAAWVFASVAALINVIVTPFLMFAARTDFYILIITLLGFMTVSFAF